MDACAGPPFKTLLMSATLTPDTVRAIETLFGPARTMRMVASIYLRPEPQYWFHREDDAQTKTQKVLEALRHAPRPFILYVTERRDARRWLRILKAEGYARLDCFHGETRSSDKVAIIDAWSHNRLDGIVATSAFGSGSISATSARSFTLRFRRRWIASTRRSVAAAATGGARLPS